MNKIMNKILLIAILACTIRSDLSLNVTDKQLSNKTIAVSLNSTQSDTTNDIVLKEGEEILAVYGRDGKINSVKVSLPPTDIHPVKQNETLQENITYQLYKEKVNFTPKEVLKENEFLIIEVTGEGRLKIEVLSSDLPDAEVLEEKSFDLYVLKVRTLIVFDSTKYFGNKTHSLRMQNVDNLNNIEFWTCNIHKATGIDMNFNYLIKVFTMFTSELRAKVILDKDKAQKSEEMRYQFQIETSLDNQVLSGKEKVSMHLNYNDTKFPTKNQYQMKASATAGQGIIKTVNKNSRHFCNGESCEYYVTIFVSNVDYVRFYPKYIQNHSKMTFSSTLNWIEEIESDEAVSYEMIPMNKNAKSFFFIYTPIENFSACKIKIGEMPKDENDYHFKLSSGKREDIYITEEEFKKIGYTSNRIFVQFSGIKDGPVATLRLKIGIADLDDIVELSQNSITNGIGFDDEIVKYFIDLSENGGEYNEIGLALKIKNGSGVIIVKECLESQPECSVNKEDVKAIKTNDEKDSQSTKNLKYSLIQRTEKEFKVNYFMLDFFCEGPNLDSWQSELFSVSKTCKYAIGLVLKATEKDQSVDYRFSIDSGNGHSPLSNRKSLTIKSFPQTKQYFKFPVNLTTTDEVKVKVILYVLTGTGTLYMSTSNAYPDKNSSEDIIEILHDTSSYLQTKAYEMTVTFPRGESKEKAIVYLAMESETYSIMDLFAIIQSEEDSNSNSLSELIKAETNYHRSITRVNSFKNAENNMVFYKNFHLDLSKMNTTVKAIENLEVNINSEVYGLKICIYYFQEKLDLTKKCDFESLIDYILLSKTEIKLTPPPNLIISVQSIFDGSHKNPELPIDFSFFTSINESESKYNLLLPGSTLRGYISKDKNVKVELDFSSMAKDGVVFVNSADPELIIDIFVVKDKEKKIVSTLKNEDFGFYIPNSELFKSFFCSLDCTLIALVYTTSSTSLQFSLTYTFDQKPIMLKEGLQLKIPNNLNMYFIFQSKSENNLSLSLYSYATSMVAFSRLIAPERIKSKGNYEDEINEVKFDLKSDIGSSVQLVYSKKELSQKAGNYVLFMTSPKMNFKKVDEKVVVYRLEHHETALFYVRTDLVKLESFSTVSDTISIGELKYYLIQLSDEIDFSVATMNVQGAVSLFLEKGMNEYPTIERYWKKSVSSSGDVITVQKTEYQTVLTSYAFICGVYGNKESSFSILFLPDFQNVIRVEFQKIIDIKLDPKHYYYLDYFDDRAQFASMLYADDADVEVSILDYDKKKGEDFISKITDESNYYEKTILKKGDLPVTSNNNLDHPELSHVVIRLIAPQTSATVNFLIYDKNKPIIAPSEKRFQFAQKTSIDQIFKIKLEKSTQIVDVDVKSYFGNITFAVSRNLDDFKNTTNMADSDQKYVVYELSDSSHDIILFSEVYVKVTTFKFSKYSILVKPRNQYKRLVAGEPEIVYTKQDIDTYLYYELDSSKAAVTKSLEIDVNSVNYYNERPEMLFLNTEDYYKNLKTYLPMPILDFEQKNLEDLRQTVYKVQPIPGFYVIKIKANPNKSPLKVNIVLNNIKTIEENGLYRGLIPADQKEDDYYSLYLSEPGEFRLVLESCSDVMVKNVLFESDEDDKDMEFKTNLKQAYPFIAIDESFPEVEKSFKTIYYPIMRGIVLTSGVISFKIGRLSSQLNSTNIDKTKKSYAMMTEFKPKNKELILKDYIEIFKDEKTFEAFYVYFDFVQSQSKLRLTVRRPGFKMQLLDDYPNLEKVRLKFKVYLFSEKDFSKQIENCGLSSLDTVENSEKVITVEYDAHQIKNNTSEMLEVFFAEDDLEKFKDKEHLNVLCYVSARFFENEDEEWSVTMDLKYTNVPYFYLTIKNKYITKEVFKLILLGILTLLAFVIILVYLFILRKRQRAPSQIIRPRDNESSQDTINVFDSSEQHVI